MMRTRAFLFLLLFMPACDDAPTESGTVPEPTGVNLVVRDLSAPARSGPGRELTVTVEWENAGETMSSATAVHRLLIAQSSVETELASWTGPALEPGDTAVVVKTLVLPDTLQPGAYQLTVRLAEDAEPDTSRWNNVVRAPIQLLRLADLALANFVVEASLRKYGDLAITASFDVRNLGNGAADPFSAQVYLSSDSVLDREHDIKIAGPGRVFMVGAAQRVETGGAYSRYCFEPGTYHAFVEIDIHGEIEEWDETNNVASTTVVIPPVN